MLVYTYFFGNDMSEYDFLMVYKKKHSDGRTAQNGMEKKLKTGKKFNAILSIPDRK